MCCFGAGASKMHDEDVPVEKRKYTADAKPSATATPSPHPSWGASSRIERGMDHVESEHALGNVPEDDCLSTSGQFSACSANTAKVSNVHATSSTAQPSAEDPVTVHDRDRVAEDSQPSKLSAEDVELSLPIQDTSSGSSSCHKTAQPTERQEADSTAASSTQVRASSVPLHANVKSSVAPMHRSHEETVRKLDAAIEQFGKEKQGYDLVGVAKAYVGFEKMVIEEADRLRYNSIRLQAIGARPESAAIYMNMEKEDWNALNSMTPPAARRRSTSIQKRSSLLKSSRRDSDEAAPETAQ